VIDVKLDLGIDVGDIHLDVVTEWGKDATDITLDSTGHKQM
jgi:hypothetical protein